MKSRPLILGCAAALVGLLLGWSAAVPAAADTVEFTITDSRITESSGLATDSANQRYWTVNDSGDSGIAYALGADGEVTGTLEYRANPVDVEAVAFHDGRLYVADIGDNSERREFVTVYFFDDAEPAAQPVIYKAYDFSYPDGAHDAETLLVDGDGRLFIVTKGDDGGIYAAPENPQRQGVNELERVGDAPGLVTDGIVLDDGRFALRTYTSVEVVDPSSYEVVARSNIPLQKQGESITTTFDGEALLLGSEGKRSEVLRVDIPTGVEASPTPTPTPTKTESAEPTEKASASPTPAAEEDVPEESDSSGTSRAGTLAAVGLAAVVAVVAGGVVILVRRP